MFLSSVAWFSGQVCARAAKSIAPGSSTTVGCFEPDMQPHTAGPRPKAIAWFGPPACSAPSAGTTRLSCPPQLTPSLKTWSASQKARHRAAGLNSNASRPLFRPGPSGSWSSRPGGAPARPRCAASRRATAAALRAARPARQGAQAAHAAASPRRARASARGRARPSTGSDRSAPAAGDDAGHHVGMPAEVFRGGVEHDVDAEGDRPLQDRAWPRSCR